MKILKKIILIIIVLIVVSYFSIFVIRKVRIESIRELVYEVDSPNNLSTLRIYQRGGTKEVWFVTPMEVECSNSVGIQSTRTDFKDGHMIKLNSEQIVKLDWDESENGGEVIVANNMPYRFSCKINIE